jgi:hypothetical protein
MFIINWMFDKLGYMPKITVDIGAIASTAWPFPVPDEVKETQVKKKPALKKATTRKTKPASKKAK